MADPNLADLEIIVACFGKSEAQKPHWRNGAKVMHMYAIGCAS